MVTGVPILNMNLTTSAALTDICCASSETVMVSPMVTSRMTGPVGFWKPCWLRFFSLPLPPRPRRAPSLSSSVVRGAARGVGAFSFSFTLTLIDTRGASPRRRSSSRVRLSLRRVSSFLRSAARAAASSEAGALATAGAGAGAAAAGAGSALAAGAAAAVAVAWRRACSSLRWRTSASTLSRAAFSAARRSSCSRFCSA
ncbi:hypothetical protein D3C78_1180840 [compost metagenome]